MADNTLITPTIIAKEALMQLENNLGMANNVHREYVKEFKKVGQTVTIRKPVKFRTKDGATLDKVSIYERSDTFTISSRKHVAWDFSSLELTMTVEEYSERYIKPACIALANKVDADGLALYKDVYNCVGTPGSTPNSFDDLALGAIRLDEEACPTQDRKAVLNPKASWKIAGGQIALFHQQMVKEAYMKGTLGFIAGFDCMMDQNVNVHTVGAYSGTPLMNGATAEGATELVTDGWDASAVLAEGDVFTIAGVYAVNPVSGASTGVLRRFVCTSEATADGSGNMTIPISPTIYSASANETYLPYQTVDAVPADGAAITVLGTASAQYPQNLCFSRNAFGLVTVPIELPDGAAFKARESYNGLSIRVVKDYDITNDLDVIRLDILYGWKTLYPDIATRLIG
jgi:hypothetical protein